MNDNQPRVARQVYFVGCKGGRHEFVKIGISKNVANRTRQLRVESPFPIVTLGIFSVSSASSTEKQLHQLFAKDWVHTEWFRWSYDMDVMLVDWKKNGLPDDPWDGYDILPDETHYQSLRRLRKEARDIRKARAA